MTVVLAHGGDLSNPSGGTNRVSAFAAGLQEHGYDVTVVVPEPDDALPARLADVAVETVPVATGSVLNQPIRAAKITRRAKQVAADRDATLQLEHSTLAGVGSLLGCEDYLLDMHDLAFPSPLYAEGPLGGLLQRGVKAIEARGVKNAAQIVVVSSFMQELVQREWDVPDERFTVVPNGYFPETVAGYEGAEPDTAGSGGTATREVASGETATGEAPTDTTRVTFLGTLHPKIDTAAFVEIAELPGVDELSVVGDGAKYDELSDARAERGLDSLALYGRLPDEEAFPLVADAAVTINPQTQSRLQRASSPVKLFYYAALGTAMVVSAGPALVETLAGNDAAVAVPENEAFAPAVADLLADRDRRATIAENAGRLAADWTWADRVEDLLACYDGRGDG